MLDPWIIEEIRRREEEQRQREERSRLEIQIETPNESGERRPGLQPPPPSSDRGVTIIDLGV